MTSTIRYVRNRYQGNLILVLLINSTRKRSSWMLSRQINKIIVDFDGVLIDSNLAFAQEFTTIGNSLTGKEISIQDIFAVWGGSLHYLLPKFYPEISLAEYSRERIRQNFHLVTPSVFPGIPKALRQLSKYRKLSMLTNRKSDTLMATMGKLKINPCLFERIQSSDDSFFNKPHPRVFDDFLVPYRARETLYVGDHHKADYLPAYGAGIHFVGVLSGGISTREDFLDAGVPKKMILNSLADLPVRLGIFV
ncbi:MAG: putative hydrolase [uncultured bacterium]|nr:MAG: putative hydrolase [uncultured bacterium]